mmetsp:Transcript_33799/g.86710  ORF Transcript_33799/g.86710 Transcript_33799/m.86710 type:complete len:154 (-) Transcript_33799:1153-1614(-)
MMSERDGQKHDPLFSFCRDFLSIPHPPTPPPPSLFLFIFFFPYFHVALLTSVTSHTCFGSPSFNLHLVCCPRFSSLLLHYCLSPLLIFCSTNCARTYVSLPHSAGCVRMRETPLFKKKKMTPVYWCMHIYTLLCSITKKASSGYVQLPSTRSQ